MSETKIDSLILRNLVLNDKFFGATVSYIEPEYFSTDGEKQLFKLISSHVKHYRNKPSIETLKVDAENLKVTDGQLQEVRDAIAEIDSYSGRPLPDFEWLMDQAKSFCKERALNNAILRSIAVIDGSDKELTKGDLPELVSRALSVSFDETIGHEFCVEADDQYDFYTTTEDRIPFDLDIFNKITKNGIPRKTLTVFMSTKTGGFKTGTKCHLAARWYYSGLNVLYLTAEMSERMIRHRIDANLMRIKLDDFKDLTREAYKAKVENIGRSTTGRLFVKEFPAASAHVGHIRFLLKELKIKENFEPDVIVADYLNIFTSQRMAGRKDANSYTTVKSTAEELRALATEKNCAVITSTQSGRGGISAGEEMDLDSVSESYGIPVTADLMISIVTNEDLDSKGLIMFRQLKNRFGDTNVMNKFLVGCSKETMTLFNVDAQVMTAFIPPSEKTKPLAQEIGHNRNRGSFKNWES